VKKEARKKEQTTKLLFSFDKKWTAHETKTIKAGKHTYRQQADLINLLKTLGE
jgi:hypothetical protein